MKWQVLNRVFWCVIFIFTASELFFTEKSVWESNSERETIIIDGRKGGWTMERVWRKSLCTSMKAEIIYFSMLSYFISICNEAWLPS